MKRKTEKIDSIEKFWREWDNANELEKIDICKLAKNFIDSVKLHMDISMDLQDYEVKKYGRKRKSA